MNLWITRLFVSFIIIFSATTSFAQDVSGIWKGYFITEDGEQYKLEFQIGLQPGSSLKGVSYSYLDTRFYGKSTMKGMYSALKKVIRIEELRTVEVQSAGGGTCLMNYTLTFSTSGKEQFLEGTYLGKTENRKDPKLNGKWGDCGGGTVFLRRVETSDFTVEPFVREKPQVKTPAVTYSQPKKTTTTTAKSNTISKSKTTNQNKQTTIAQNKKPEVKTPVQTNIPKGGTSSVTTRKRTEELNTHSQQPTQQELKIIPKIVPVPVQTRSRENEMVKTFVVNHEEITIKLYDNGEIDDDTISVYLDDQPVVTNKKLGATPIVLKVKLDMSSPEHTVIMVAENLGRIPPNTSLMVILDGDKRYQVNMTSTEQKNAMVRFRYEKKE